MIFRSRKRKIAKRIGKTLMRKGKAHVLAIVGGLGLGLLLYHVVVAPPSRKEISIRDVAQAKEMFNKFERFEIKFNNREEVVGTVRSIVENLGPNAALKILSSRHMRILKPEIRVWILKSVLDGLYQRTTNYLKRLRKPEGLLKKIGPKLTESTKDLVERLGKLSKEFATLKEVKDEKKLYDGIKKLADSLGKIDKELLESLSSIEEISKYLEKALKLMR